MFNLLSLAIEFACMYMSFKLFLNRTVRPNKDDCIACLGILLLLSLLPTKYPLLITLSGHIVYFLYSFFLCKKQILPSVILYGFSSCLMVLLQLFMSLPLSWLQIDTDTTIMHILGNACTMLGIVLLFQIPKLKSLYFKIIQAKPIYHMLFLNTYFIFLIGIVLYKMKPGFLIRNIGFILFIMLFLVVVNVCILYYDSIVRLKERELSLYKKNLPIYETLIAEIRANQHEYSNRIQNIQNLAQICPDYESLRRELNRSATEYAKPLHAYPLLRINMPLLASALYRQYTIAEKKNITITFDIINANLQTSVSEQLFSDLACILTQNAIEACHAGDNIYIHMKSEQGTLQFEIRNPVPKLYNSKEIQMFFSPNFSSKPNTKEQETPHGYGLYYLHKTVLKHKGTISTICTEHNGTYWMVFRLIL